MFQLYISLGLISYFMSDNIVLMFWLGSRTKPTQVELEEDCVMV